MEVGLLPRKLGLEFAGINFLHGKFQGWIYNYFDKNCQVHLLPWKLPWK